MRSVIRLLLSGLAVAAVIAAVIFAVVAAAPPAARAQGGPERITSYDTAFAIQLDGSVVVTEQIVYDFGGNERHGIFRVIPVKSRYNSSYDRTYTLTVLSVQSPDAPAQYQVENNGSSVSIRIGDPGQLVTGQRTYRLTYRLRGVLTAFASHDEFYWNATGNQWNVPIGRAAVHVSAPAQVIRAACYAGPAGSTRPCQQGGITNGAAAFTQTGLGPHEGVTVAVAIPTGVVAVPRPVLAERWAFQRAFAATPATLGVSGGLLLALIVAGAVIVRAKRRDRLVAGPQDAMPAGGRDQPPMETAPPEGLRPAQAGLLLTGVAGSREITGTIVDLAVRGYLQIEDVAGEQRPGSRDWQLVWPPEANNQFGYLLDYEQTLLDGLLKNAVQEDGKPHVWLSLVAASAPLRQVRRALYTQAVDLGWFTARPDRVRRRWRVTGWLVLVISLLLLLAVAASTHAGLVPVPFLLAGLAMIAGTRWMPVRTQQGRQLASRLLAFRDYLKTATVAQARTGGRGALYDYLPYAIVFGCTSEWAVVTAALTGTSEAPSWYRSSRPLSVTDLALLAQAAHYFTPRHVVTNGFWAWSGSGASGGSGSGGSGSGGSGFSGGYSGGGMGGGGGGSW